MALPKLTDAQRAAALKKAKEVRKARAKIKEELKKGKIKLADVFKKAKDPVYGKMYVKALLQAMPNTGKVKAENIMTEIGISVTRRVQGLGKNQQDALIKKFS